MQVIKQVCSLLTPELGHAVEKHPQAEELRLRLGQRPTAVLCGREIPVSEQRVDRADLQRILEAATRASFHAASSLRSGFIRCHSLRIGVCGETAQSGDEQLGLRNISSLAIRIPHETDEAARTFAADLLRDGVRNTLIAAPPGAGKTSLLRALIRQASDAGHRVGVIDERGEIWAADMQGQGFELGRCSDVVTGLGKLPAAMQLLRCMNPEIIAMDEITQPEDMQAVKEIRGCGVLLFATLHAADREDMLQRPLGKALLEENVFDRLICIRLQNGKRTYALENAEA